MGYKNTNSMRIITDHRNDGVRFKQRSEHYDNNIGKIHGQNMIIKKSKEGIEWWHKL